MTISMTATKKRLRLGFFSFTGCEGCMIVFLEILNTKYDSIKELIDIRYSKLMKTKNDIKDMDVAFVEGAISTKKEVERIKEVRTNSKRLVAIGTCAISGAPANHRNFFDEGTKERIQFIVQKFNQLEEVQPIKDFVRVDASVPGCPMMEDAFLEVLERYFREFGVR